MRMVVLILVLSSLLVQTFSAPVNDDGCKYCLARGENCWYVKAPPGSPSACAKYTNESECEASAYAAVWCGKPPVTDAAPTVECCCEGCSPGGCVASISTQSTLNTTDRCSSLQPPNGYCNNSTMIYEGHGAAAGSSYCSEPQNRGTYNTIARAYKELPGGDCCPGVSECEGGTGPFAISTGGDYPEMSKPVCDRTPGCEAFGQMYKYVTRFHFSSKDTCEASQRSNVSLGDYHCDEGPVSPVALADYSSVLPMHAKMPYTCFTTSTH